MIKRIVKLHFRIEETDAFVQLFEDTKTQIRHFPGCLHLELLRQKDDPAVFFTFSFWESEAALEAYRQSELFEKTWKATKALFAEKAMAWTVQVVSA
ncbi:MAG TPA: antibiotic biosynthesis monooxygenase [Saprospiraceae bacterium]|nr:antibiotic biosynthesis monooxygenase [Saprospiraceae bacterium]HMQ82504.1 antibiotic biosynthesis monooxygenase [Saprospiraceae bacterium]